MLFVVRVAVPVGVRHIVHLIDRRKAFRVKDILNMLSRKTRPKICVQNDILFVLPLSMKGWGVGGHVRTSINEKNIAQHE